MSITIKTVRDYFSETKLLNKLQHTKIYLLSFFYFFTFHVKLKRNSRFKARKSDLQCHHAMHHFNAPSGVKLFWCLTNHILKKGPITPSRYAPLSSRHANYFAVSWITTWKKGQHGITPTAGSASSMVNPLTGHTLRLEFLRTKSGTVGLQNRRKKSFSLENMRNSPPNY